MVSQAFIKGVVEAIRPDLIEQSPEVLAEYGQDWTRIYTPNPMGVAFPRSTSEVSTLLKLCQDYQVGVVPSGGRTGLAGGAVARSGELVVSLDKMAQIDAVSVVARTVRVQAGAVTAAVHEHCAKEGLTWPVDFASSGSSQIGGNIATNAGGVRVVRYGLSRQWVLGLEVVLMGGEVLELNGELEKNNTGMDLRQLFIGSEGVLGIVTQATLKLVPLPQATGVALLGVNSLHDVLQIFEVARREPQLSIMAFEYFEHDCLEAVMRHARGRAPFGRPCPCYVLVEVEGASGEVAQNTLAGWLETCFEKGLVVDGVVAQSGKDAAELWSLRESISEALTRQAFLYKYDVAVPVRSLADFKEALLKVVDSQCKGYPIFLFGHVGDGNLHLNVLKPDSIGQKEFLTTCELAQPAIYELIREYHGSVSAEHGIGLLKKSALPYSRGETELKFFRAIKAGFDPDGLMNPGKIFD